MATNGIMLNCSASKLPTTLFASDDAFLRPLGIASMRPPRVWVGCPSKRDSATASQPQALSTGNDLGSTQHPSVIEPIRANAQPPSRQCPYTSTQPRTHLPLSEVRALNGPPSSLDPEHQHPRESPIQHRQAKVADEGLSLATDQSHSEIVAALLDAGTKLSPSAVGYLPGEHGHQDVDIVRQFLDHGLDPNSRYKKGWPILGFFPDLACARELLSREADPNLRNDNGEPILGMVISSAAVADASLVELFLDFGARLSSSLLFYSVAPRVPQGEFMTRHLLSKGLDPNVTSEEWGTPLHYAAYAQRPNIVKLLFEAGADITVRSTGRKTLGQTPAEIAEMVGHPGIRDTLLRLLRVENISGSTSTIRREDGE